MNYLKFAAYAFVIAVFFYSLMEMASINVRIFSGSFFTLSGFIAAFIFVLVELLFAAYSLDYGRKKDAEEAKAN